MKSNHFKTIVIVVVIIILGVLFLFTKKPTDTMDQSNGTQATQSPVTKTPVSQSPKASASKAPVTTRTTAPAPVSGANPINTNTSYQNYMNQLLANQNKCEASAQSQYKALYASNLEASTYQSLYNSKTGICYEKVTGQVHPAYSSSKTDNIYFRNVTSNTLLVDCVDTTGGVGGSDAWKCTDKTNGQAINYAKFNSIVYNATAE
jgi:hypothetical protein